MRIPISAVWTFNEQDAHLRGLRPLDGNRGTGTSGYRDYGRDHLIEVGTKPAIEASSDPAFRGDVHRYNSEELLVASVSSCHMLWYLHLCAVSQLRADLR